MQRTDRDTTLLFAARFARLFAYGFFSVALALYLSAIGFSERQIGLLLSLTLGGDAVISLWMTTSADRIGRRRMLIVGGVLMALSGIAFIATRNPILLMIAAVLGVISPSGNEIGPFLSIEQAALSQLVSAKQRTRVFAWYNLAGSVATAVGALCGGLLARRLQLNGATALQSYRAVILGYSFGGALLTALFLFLSPSVEVERSDAHARLPFFGLSRSRNVVLKLSGLFAMDAFAGGFTVQSILAYWFHLRFNADIGTLGTIFFGANLLAGFSSLAAAGIARRVGLIRTMVYTHIPSNFLLMLVPLMPTLSSAIAVLLVRFSISQMDVPTRQSFTMAVVEPAERSAASGVTNIARSVGASLSPALTGMLLANPLLMNVPFFLAGGLKVCYDLLLYRSFRKLTPPEESQT